MRLSVGLPSLAAAQPSLRCVAAVLALVATFCGLLRSQDTLPVPVGTRLRVVLSSDSPAALPLPRSQRRAVVVGTLVNWDDDQLRLRLDNDAAQLSIRLSQVLTLQLQRGRRRRTDDGFLYGTALGVVGGIALFVKTGSRCTDPNFLGGCLGGGETTIEEADLARIGLMTVLGAGLGALVGSRFFADRWEDIPPGEWRPDPSSLSAHAACQHHAWRLLTREMEPTGAREACTRPTAAAGATEKEE